MLPNLSTIVLIDALYRQQQPPPNANHSMHADLDELEAKLLRLVPGYTSFSDHRNRNLHASDPVINVHDQVPGQNTEYSTFAPMVSPLDGPYTALDSPSQQAPLKRESFSGPDESLYSSDNQSSAVGPVRQKRRVSEDGSFTTKRRPNSRRGSTQRIPRDAAPRRTSEPDIDPRIRHMEDMYASYLRGDVNGSRPGSSRI